MKKAVRIIFAVLALSGFILFGFPVFRHVLNVGNVAGLILSLIFLLVAIFAPSIGNLLKKAVRSTGGKVVVGMIGILILAIIGLCVITGTRIMGAWSVKPDENATVVVLGCKVNGTAPSLALSERIHAAYDYLKIHEDVPCIVSGGQGDGEDISEAQCMRDELVSLGISEDRIYMEDQSKTTEENMEYSAEIIRQNNFSSDVAIVTNEFHMYRAEEFAKEAGLRPGTVPAKTAFWLFPTFFVREQIGILYGWICG